MNQFGGNWTKIKIEILIEYAKAYLTIMKNRKYFKLLYFDGFAGSGEIVRLIDDKIRGVYDIDITIGAAKRIIEIDDPRSFDEYYFVEKDPKNYKQLEDSTKNAFPKKKIFTIQEDCNKKLLDLSNYLRNPKNKNYRTLAFIDPCGMQVEWRSIECLRNLPIDMWVLVPTGLGVNRLLKKDGQISDAWLEKLELFLGMLRQDIEKFFYKKNDTLFPDIKDIKKEKDAIDKSAKLYHNRLKEVFDFVSKPYELRNNSNSIMYHLYLTSNNESAINIANDIVKKYTK
ncbi:MAG TPA: three-Cys-motif partner protein TcmP [Hanamia sp.]|nr:three-Cys-motif partner protein TcmP [Hanamia sp.]